MIFIYVYIYARTQTYKLYYNIIQINSETFIVEENLEFGILKYTPQNKLKQLKQFS